MPPLADFPRRLQACLFALAACLMVPALQGSGWRSTLYPENWQPPTSAASFYTDAFIQDFSFAGYRRGEVPIPNVTGPVFNVVTGYGADPTGATDSTVAIQNAINAAAAAGGGVVFLPAGEFRVSPQGASNTALRISSSGVILRGAGVGQTFLLNTSFDMRGKAVITVAPTSIGTQAIQSITGDLPGPTRRIPVANPGAFNVGDTVRIEWSFTAAWIAEHGQQAFWSGEDVPANARYLREVTAVNIAHGWIEVDVPTRYAIFARDDATVLRVTGLVSEVALEDFSLGNLQHPGTVWGEEDYADPDRPAFDVHASWLVRFTNVRDGWISDVHSYRPAANTSTAHLLSNGISLNNCFRVTVRNTHMRRAQYGGGGGNGYMFRLQYSNECLVRNSIADFSRHGFVVSHAGTSGNVFLQCEDRETARATGHAGGYTTSGSGSDNHMHFSHSNLWDQCTAHNSFYTAHHRGNSGTIPHALTSAHAVYWNITGSGTRGDAVVRSEQSRYGYVIGTRGARSSVTNNTRNNTAPADIVQGVGQGANLQPQSLYLDQLDRRLNPAVVYSANGATAGAAPLDPLSPYSPEATVTVLDPGELTRTGHAFAGWNTAPDGTGQAFAPEASFTLVGTTYFYAQWTALSYTVSFDARGGEPATLDSRLVAFGSPYGALPVLERPGFSFLGWFTAPEGGDLIAADTPLAIDADHTLVARWTAPPLVDAGPSQAVLMDRSIPWTPLWIKTAAWFDAANPDTLTVVNGAVSAWLDQSGQANHAIQSTANVRPAFAPDALGGLPAVSFRVGDGIARQFMTIPDAASLRLDAAGGVNIFAAMRYLGFIANGSTGVNAPLSKGNLLQVEAAYGMRVGGNNALGFKSGTDVMPGVNGFLAQPLIYAGVTDQTARTGALYVNGALGNSVASEDPIISDNSHPLLLGRDLSTSRYADVDFGELIILGGALSPAERQRIEGYLAHKWSLADALPLGHRHRHAAPQKSLAVVELSGSAISPEDKPLAHAWSVVAGPGEVFFADASALQTTATFGVEGAYTLRLTSADDLGHAFDDVLITVTAPQPANPFVIWFGGLADEDAPPTFIADANADGVPDGIAWLLGVDSSETDATPFLPALTVSSEGIQVSFGLLAPADRLGSEVRLQHSPDLVAWSTVSVPDANGTHDGIHFDIVPDGDRALVTATLPPALATETGRLFVRLVGVLHQP